MVNRTSEGVNTFFIIFCSPSTLSVENRTSEGIGARRRATVPCPPLWPGNKVLKPNFQSIISQTNNGCSLLSLILAKLLLLDISCENIFSLSVVTALTARPAFSMKKCAKMSVFLYENRKNPLGAGVSPPDPRLWPPFAKSWVRYCLRARSEHLFFALHRYCTPLF